MGRMGGRDVIVRGIQGAVSGSGFSSIFSGAGLEMEDRVVLGTREKMPVTEALLRGLVGPRQDPYVTDEETWNPIAEERLEAFFDKVKSGQIQKPIAVFDADGTLWRNDVGEGFARWLIENGKLKGDSGDGDIYKQYEELVARDPGEGFAFLVTAMRGIAETDLTQWAKEYFSSFEQNVFPKQKELVHRLREAGVDVWIVSASNRWIVEAGASRFGISPDHVIGLQTEVQDGILTDKIIPPIIHGPGKVEAIRKWIGDRVDFVSGNSLSDYDMLSFSSGLSLVINPRNEGPEEQNLTQLAKKHDWVIQRWP
ncbi:MAG: haloacid dehalogenase-like hydrolase [Armatimonadetes bacterium]|nr:haloacid dehalogenase-like hydrolase [Armatimonadota bacterium]